MTACSFPARLSVASIKLHFRDQILLVRLFTNSHASNFIRDCTELFFCFVHPKLEPHYTVLEL